MQREYARRSAYANGFDVHLGITEDGPQSGGQRWLRLCRHYAGSHLDKHLRAIPSIRSNVENQVARTYKLRVELAQCLGSVPQVRSQIPVPQLTRRSVNTQIAHDIENGFHCHA